jgi:peptide/nickel transport system permease protein
MAEANSPVILTSKPRRQTLERRLGLEHSMFWTTAFRTLRAPGGWLGLAIIVIMVLMAIGAPLISPYDPLELHKTEQFLPPQAKFLFGTDEFGRDLLSRTIWAGRISLLAGAFAVAFAMGIGVPLGLVAGYFGRATDAILMRAMDTLLAFPAILLAMAIVAVIGPGSINAMIAVAIVSIPTFARVARSSMLTQKAMDYVTAARAVGAQDWRIIFRSILPNAIPVVLVQVAVSVAFAILVEAALSFLGLGTQPPDPSWGNLLQVSRNFLRQAWWYGIFPGLFLTTLIVGLNLFSEALRDALDPTRRSLF